MLSWSLWRLISEPDTNNPIFKRVSQIHQPAVKKRRRPKIPRLLVAVSLIALAAILIQSPHLLLLVLEIPVVMITLVVMSPVLLPFVILLAGLWLISEVIDGIYREKHQYTYDLICVSTKGSLNANWSFAMGILHRGGWFSGLRWGTRLSLRLGQGILAALALLTLCLVATNSHLVGFEQLRLLLMPALLLTLYYTHMTQTFVISLMVGLYASSFDWVKRDVTWVGMVLYVLAQCLPFLLALLVYMAFHGFRCAQPVAPCIVLEPHPLVTITLDSISLMTIVLTREVIIILLRHSLTHRLNASTEQDDDELRSSVMRSSAFIAP